MTPTSLIYKITNSLDYEASRYAVIQEIEAHVFEHFSYWKFEGEDGNYVICKVVDGLKEKKEHEPLPEKEEDSLSFN